MNDQILWAYNFNLQYLDLLVKDITPEQMVLQPAGIKNHPTWQLGHLAYAAGGAAKLSGASFEVPGEWNDLFAPGSNPTPHTDDYPSKDELLEALKRGHQAVSDKVAGLDFSQMNDPCDTERRRKIFGTTGNLLLFMLVGHEQTHLGQLSTWRRAAGLPSVL